MNKKKAEARKKKQKMIWAVVALVVILSMLFLAIAPAFY